MTWPEGRRWVPSGLVPHATQDSKSQSCPRLAGPGCSPVWPRTVPEGSSNDDRTQPPLTLVPGPLTLGVRSWSRSNAGELCGRPGPQRFPKTPTHPRWWSNRGKGPLTRTSSNLSPDGGEASTDIRSRRYYVHPLPRGGEGRGEGTVNHRLHALSYHIPGRKSLWPRLN